jgi:HPt (histidine-containing phosphotransfer) domain-containing protein
VLETERALARVNGNQALYRRLLQDFVKTHCHLDEKIQSHLEEESYEAACSLLHSFAGVSANLGAEHLAAAARELLEDLRHHKPFEDVSDPFAAFTLQLKETIAAMAQQITLLAEHSDQKMDGPVDLELIEEIKGRLENADPVAESIWLARSEGFAQWLGAEKYDEINQAMEQYHFKKALQLLQQFQKEQESGQDLFDSPA